MNTLNKTLYANVAMKQELHQHLVGVEKALDKRKKKSADDTEVEE